MFRTLLISIACAFVASCGDPCKALSEKICGCMPTLAQQQSCTARVGALASQDKSNTDAGRQACAALVDTCSCEALADGNLKACGLARPQE